MSMKRYDSYKDTGISWIGEIPSHWEVKRGKFVSRILAGFPFDSDKFTTDEGYMPLIRIRDINSATTEMNYSGSYIEDYVIRRGDVLIGMDGDFNISQWGGEDALLNQRVCKVEDGKELLAKFAYYLLPRPLQLINDICYATTVKHLSTYDVLGTFLPVPPIGEQKAIAEYLDKKCGSIDGIIATQGRRIALLNELKQTIITEAVTRGTNPNAPLKDSGIDWIGQILEHWEVRKVTHIFKNIGSGTTPSTDISDYYDESGLNWLQTGDLNDSFITETSKHITPLAVAKCNLKQYHPGSLVIAMYGATVGKLGILSISTTVNQACCVLTPSSTIDIEFAYFSFLAAKQYLISLSTGGGQPNISQDVISRHKLALPPYKEQIEIVKKLRKKCTGIDSALAKAKREVELLKEYKQTVITEAVTGKIKVY